MALVLFILLMVLFLINVPIAVALGLASTLVFFLDGNVSLIVIIQRMFNSVDSFPLMAIPFFILAGKLMESGGISQRLIHLANVIFGRVKGGLGIVSIVACAFFAAISGSAAATTAAVGALMIPAMVNKGYDKSFATAIQAAGGTIGIMIPPSVPLVLYGVAAGVSVSDLFIAGIVPGLFVMVSLILLVYLISLKEGYGGGEKFGFKDFFKAFFDAFLALMMPVIILGGIYGGIFTPTEAAVVAVVYGLIVGIFIYREIKFKDLIHIFSSSVVVTAVIMFIIAGASVFGYYLTRQRIPAELTELMLGVTENWIIALLIINLLLLICGVFLETSAAIIILTPILVPIASALGIDLVHFGIIMIVNLGIGFITPPVGVNLFVAANIAGTKFESLLKAIVPFILIMIVDVIIISFIPGISLFLLGD
ncbi:TRAP transporter large permease [Microbacterium sp. APC 3898]|uniref:TRAP transporter large permease n=2 Tax=Planococcus TaxID=1372 RepID=A0ABT7ZMB3_9BACL|nr:MULTISPECIES: TRAP transporter large permease [Terrabacteria group]MBF6635009.1 TRAP transporter large permease [Planococcus sp. (in: firmicutes)]MBD8015908.1 TRAP transporter large permease [Planococcus wigleyi]MDN3428311.1 TRAP transporter large permease [Planococcus sp. APC 4016]MDN3438639.1 TRAP transporter large permease [Planococcus sp. APC 3900]MDN3498982.1 TRAP transporter large permease [Microbacterium sp. APC 3898]